MVLSMSMTSAAMINKTAWQNSVAEIVQQKAIQLTG